MPRSQDAAEALDFERALEELEAIIERIEQGEVSLQESLDQYRRGALLVRRCRALLDAAEQEVERITAEDLAARARAGQGDREGGDADDGDDGDEGRAG